VSIPNLSLNLSLCDSIVTIVGEMVTRVSFASRGNVSRELRRSGLTRIGTTNDVPKPRMPLPRGKTVVRSVPAWGDASSCNRGGFLEKAIRPSWRDDQTVLEGRSDRPCPKGGG
jgi:hypothetical protein